MGTRRYVLSVDNDNEFRSRCEWIWVRSFGSTTYVCFTTTTVEKLIKNREKSWFLQKKKSWCGAMTPRRIRWFLSLQDVFLTTTAHIAPKNLDRSLNEGVTDKVRKYRPDYNNNPPSVISFMSVIVSTSGRLHTEFIRLLFLQDHRETDRFFAASGVHLA
jgi:hypothetical protein